MQNDSIEVLLLRHYGSMAPVPTGLEQRVSASIQQEAGVMQQQQRVAANLRTQRVSRRRAVRLMAIGSAGLGLLSVGLESVHMLETSLLGQDHGQTATS